MDGDVLLHYGAWKADSLELAIDQLDKTLEDWLDYSYCDSLSLALGARDSWNYRYELYPGYKQIPTRIKERSTRPPWWADLKEELASREFTVVEDLAEADDVIGHWSSVLEPESYVIITVDKDLNQLPGYHYNPKTQLGSYVSTFSANRFFLEQLLVGDSVDRIPGLPGLGPKKAEVILASYQTNEELLTYVLDAYQTLYKNDWVNYFLINAKLLWIQRYPKDWFSLDRLKQHYFGPAKNF